MWHWLETWRGKSEHWRRTCALLVAGGLTLIVVVLWVITFFPHAETEEAAHRAAEAPSPLAAFRDSAERAFGSAQEQLKGLDEAFKSGAATTSTSTKRGGN